MVSVRASVEPLNTALGNPATIFLQGSFVGLPIINQALAHENPIAGGSFFVTVRALIKAIETTSIDAVLKAVAQANAASTPHTPPTPPFPPVHHVTGPPLPSAATCTAELDLDQPGGGGITGVRIFGGGFVAGAPGEPVDIIEAGQVVATTNADLFGQYSVHTSILEANPPVDHTFHAKGEMSGRISNDTVFNN
jgi:hypothetical protein